ncbi:zinc-binding alcohol dehydrogenase family protein [Micromonospora sp. NBC_01412]|uniref:quinone oxidoreductase family protein n=1 Tax=Micromonospora sp. NBC_01412 TaxID=2903590 RepID=UPI00324FE850
MHAISLTGHGPGGLEIHDVPDPVAAGNQTLLRVRSAGVNFSDVHIVEGSYSLKPPLPYRPGIEAVGTAADGRRMLGRARQGAWAEVFVAEQFLEVPDFVSDRAALAMATQGFTAWHILRTMARITRGDTVAVMAAAGGVGSIAVQLAKAWGARRVIGAASTPDKRAHVAALGADETVDSTTTDIGAALVEANGGRMVDVILEMHGGPQLDSALAALAPCGRMVIFGSASGEPSTPVRPESLMAGTRTIAGFSAYNLVSDRHEVFPETMVGLFGMIKKGQLDMETGRSYPFKDVAQAVTDMRARVTTGKVTLDFAG